MKYVVNTNFDGVRESLLESFCLSERACREKELLFGNGTIYKDKRPLPFKEAYKQKSVRKELASERERPHGFVRPLSIHQIITWIVLSSNVFIQIYILQQNAKDFGDEESSAFIIFTIVSFSSDIAVFVFGLLATIRDPSDITVHEERYCRLTKQRFDDSAFEYFCNHCDTNVKEFSKHCGRCQRCAQMFDHHCVWLNNCIGYNNYRVFFCLLCVTLLHSANIIALLGWNLGHGDSSVPHWRAVEIVSYTFIAINGLAFLLLGYLLLYHIWLSIVGKTTYQHIVECR